MVHLKGVLHLGRLRGYLQTLYWLASNVLRTLINYGLKKFYNTGPVSVYLTPNTGKTDRSERFYKCFTNLHMIIIKAVFGFDCYLFGPFLFYEFISLFNKTIYLNEF